MSPAVISKRIRLGARSAGMLMTPAEFDAVTRYDERYRYELIRGVLVVSPPPGNAEVDPNQELGCLLWYYQHYHPQGSCLDLTLYEQTIYTTNRRRADRAVWAGLGRLPDVERDMPTILVEFVSPRRRDIRRDYEEKRAEYLAGGVKEYWIIDRAGRKMTVFRGRPDGVEELIISEDQHYQTALLPGFSLPLARLLGLADRWKRKPGPRRPR